MRKEKINLYHFQLYGLLFYVICSNKLKRNKIKLDKKGYLSKFIRISICISIHPKIHFCIIIRKYKPPEIQILY